MVKSWKGIENKKEITLYSIIQRSSLVCVLANVFQDLHTHIQTCEHLSACTHAHMHARTHKYILFEFLTPILSPEFSPLRPGLIFPDDSKGGHLTQSELMRAQGLLCHGFEAEGMEGLEQGLEMFPLSFNLSEGSCLGVQLNKAK